MGNLRSHGNRGDPSTISKFPNFRIPNGFRVFFGNFRDILRQFHGNMGSNRKNLPAKNGITSPLVGVKYIGFQHSYEISTVLPPTRGGGGIYGRGEGGGVVW